MKTTKRVISLLLCAVLLLGMIPVTARADAWTAEGTENLFLKPNANWQVDDARFAVYFFNNTSNTNVWVDMKAIGDSGIYRAVMPKGDWEGLIFCRMNPTAAENNWTNKWNQTDDLTYDGSQNFFTVPDGGWDGNTSEWSTLEALWGASADALTVGGTLDAALAAAKASSEIRYIQLQKDAAVSASIQFHDSPFTLDLNGHNMSGEALYAYAADASLTILDSSTYDESLQGSVSNTILCHYGGSVIIEGGRFTEQITCGTTGNLTIRGGSFTGVNPVLANGKVYIFGGDFTNTGEAFTAALTIGSGADVTVIVGTLDGGTSGGAAFYYLGGKLDLSSCAYLEGMTLFNEYGTGAEANITLPEGYAYFLGATQVTALEKSNTYTIKKPVVLDPNAETFWGASADELTGSGTLDAALAAAEASADVRFIQLQKDAAISQIPYEFVLTLDLNGHNMSGVYLNSRSAAVVLTILDSSTDDVSLQGSVSNVIFFGRGSSLIVEGGRFLNTIGSDSSSSITIRGGSFTGGNPVSVNGKVTISGGVFTNTANVDSGALRIGRGADVTVTGGTFDGGTSGGAAFYYSGGKLDLSGYADLEGMTLRNAYGTGAQANITLPEGYAYFLGATQVTTLEISKTYTIKKPVCTCDVKCGDVGSAECAACASDTARCLGLWEIACSRIILGNALDMNFAVHPGHRDDWTGVYAQVTKEYADGRADHVETIPFADWKTVSIEGENYYYFDFSGIAAKEMMDDVSVTVYDSEGSAISAVYTTSVCDYASDIFDENDDTVKTLLADMLVYGAAAQETFGYGTDCLATSALTDDQLAMASTTLEACGDRRISHGGFLGTRLVLENRICFQLAFAGQIAADHATVSFTDHYGNQKEKTVQPVYMDGVWVVEVDDLVLADARQDVSVVFYDTDGNKCADVTDSVESYVARMGADQPPYMAIMKFADSARYYFANRT